MIRIALYLAAILAVVTGRQSPNADRLENLLKTSKGSRFSNNILEDASLDAPGLITKYGYPVEIHKVVTIDGYILETHRIPYGRDRNNQPGARPVIFLMHGLLSSSADFLVLGPGNALAYVLAEEGYDVWLGNARGNYYSRNHTTLNPDNKRNADFWKFSWEQIGLYDLPAFVDHILSTTGQKKLHYVGHSQGGTTFLVLNSLKPEYNEKFISFQGLAPAAYFTNNENSMFNSLAPFEKLLETTAFSAGFAEIDSQFVSWVTTTFCSEDSLFQPLCAGVGSTTFDTFNSTMIPIFLGHAPAGASIRQIAHYGQSIRRDTFSRFYFDSLTNLRVYGRLNPPAFNMAAITVPTFLHYGLSDSEVDYRDLIALAGKLGNLIALNQAERPSFNHFDFIWGSNIKVEIYDRMFEFLRLAETGDFVIFQ